MATPNEFKHSMEKLFRDQELQEAKIDFKELEAHVCFDNFLNPEEMRESSDFFNDPTLLTHIRRYKESKENKVPHNQVRRMNGADRIIKRKPQAKSVEPHRVLAKEDEAIYLKTQKELDKDCYINPQVPKRRVYLAQTQIPAVILSLGASSPQSSSVEATNKSSSETMSVSDDNATIDNSDNLSGFTENSQMNSREPSVTNEDHDDNDTVDNAISIMENSDVPETDLSRKLVDMANRIKRSQLKTLSLDNNADLLPRQHKQLNYIAMKQGVNN
ncbi:hypothetical protein CLU79DRAFT_753703 [Phycomyces nitens]|nr:hypothetical protein CLU79DRAFT_753703 [Phycomyces nitens]